jgi:hypothetical protein
MKMMKKILNTYLPYIIYTTTCNFNLKCPVFVLFRSVLFRFHCDFDWILSQRLISTCMLYDCGNPTKWKKYTSLKPHSHNCYLITFCLMNCTVYDFFANQESPPLCGGSIKMYLPWRNNREVLHAYDLRPLLRLCLRLRLETSPIPIIAQFCSIDSLGGMVVPQVKETIRLVPCPTARVDTNIRLLVWYGTSLQGLEIVKREPKRKPTKPH